MKFSVCIAATRATTLGAAIESIRRQTWSDWELIILGQGADASLKSLGEAAAQTDSRIRYIHLERQGLSVARNAGLRAATGEIIAMTDDDCEAQADWLAVLAEYFSAEPDVGLVGGALLAPKPSRQGLAVCPAFKPIEALYDPVADGRKPPRGWDWVGGNFALRRSVAEQIGQFDEHLGAGAIFPAGEETDYKLRMEALGIKMRSTPRSVVYHTFGYRYGLRAMLRHARNYAQGNAGLAGKLTLMGDPRGQEWLARTKHDCLQGWLKRHQPQRLPANLLRLWHYQRTYNRCLRDYRVDPTQSCLVSMARTAFKPS